MDKEMKQLINETLPSFVGIDKIGIFINLSVTFVQVMWRSIVLVIFHKNVRSLINPLIVACLLAYIRIIYSQIIASRLII